MAAFSQRRKSLSGEGRQRRSRARWCGWCNTASSRRTMVGVVVAAQDRARQCRARASDDMDGRCERASERPYNGTLALHWRRHGRDDAATPLDRNATTPPCPAAAATRMTPAAARARVFRVSTSSDVVTVLFLTGSN